MVAADLVATGHSNGRQAMMRMLFIGSPSIEQLAFEYDLGRGRDYERPNLGSPPGQPPLRRAAVAADSLQR